MILDLGPSEGLGFGSSGLPGPQTSVETLNPKPNGLFLRLCVGFGALCLSYFCDPGKRLFGFESKFSRG